MNMTNNSNRSKVSPVVSQALSGAMGAAIVTGGLLAVLIHQVSGLIVLGAIIAALLGAVLWPSGLALSTALGLTRLRGILIVAGTTIVGAFLGLGLAPDGAGTIAGALLGALGGLIIWAVVSRVAIKTGR